MFSNQDMDSVMKGRDEILREYNLDSHKIDSIGNDNDLLKYIKTNRSKGKGSDKFLMAVAKKNFLPKDVNGTSAFTPLYDNAPLTTGDSVETFMYSLARGKGLNVKKEVLTRNTENPTFNIYGKEYTLMGKKTPTYDRYSDLVNYRNNGVEDHYEFKTGCTMGKEKIKDLLRENLGDFARMDRNPNTTQTYALYTNPKSGKSQLDIQEYAQFMRYAKENYKNARVFLDNRELSLDELTMLANKPTNIKVQDCLNKPNLRINDTRSGLDDTAINLETDRIVRSVNASNDIDMTHEARNIISSSDKMNNVRACVGQNTSRLQDFGSGFSNGFVNGGMYSAFGSSINAIGDMISGRRKFSSDMVVDILKDSAKGAVANGFVTGMANMGSTPLSKLGLGFAGSTLVASAGALKSYINGDINTSQLCNEVVRNGCQVGGRALAIGAAKRFVGGLCNVGACSGGLGLGTSKAAKLLGCGSKVAAGLFIGSSLLSLFKNKNKDKRSSSPTLIPCGINDYEPYEIPSYNMSIGIGVSPRGYYTVDIASSQDMIDALMSYNNIIAKSRDKRGKFQEDIKQAEKLQAYARSQRGQGIDEAMDTINNYIGYKSQQIHNQNAEIYSNNLDRLVRKHIEKQLLYIDLSKAKVNDLRQVANDFYNEEQISLRAKNCCDQIIKMARNSNVPNKEIRSMMNDIAKAASNTHFVLGDVNEFTTGYDILMGVYGR